MVLVNCPLMAMNLKRTQTRSSDQSATVLMYNIHPDVTKDDLRAFLDPVTGPMKNLPEVENGAILLQVPSLEDANSLKACFDGVFLKGRPIYADMIVREGSEHSPTRTGLENVKPTGLGMSGRKKETTLEELDLELDKYVVQRRESQQ